MLAIATSSTVYLPVAPPAVSAAGNGVGVVLPASNSVTPTVSSAQVGNNASGDSSSAFLTQLLAQGDSGDTQSILVEYNKLNAYSAVKYAPSEAGKPLPEPAGLFSQFIQQNKGAALPVVSTPAATTNTAQQNDSITVPAGIAATVANAGGVATTNSTPALSGDDGTMQQAATQANSAYLASVSRLAATTASSSTINASA